MVHDRLCRSERIGSDAEDDRVPSTQHTGCIGEDIRATLEDEPDDSQSIDDLVQRPSVVIDRVRPVKPVFMAASRSVTLLLQRNTKA